MQTHRSPKKDEAWPHPQGKGFWLSVSSGMHLLFVGWWNVTEGIEGSYAPLWWIWSSGRWGNFCKSPSVHFVGEGEVTNRWEKEGQRHLAFQLQVLSMAGCCTLGQIFWAPATLLYASSHFILTASLLICPFYKWDNGGTERLQSRPLDHTAREYSSTQFSVPGTKGQAWHHCDVQSPLYIARCSGDGAVACRCIPRVYHYL